MRRPVYIVDGARTPFIKARGRPGPFTPVDLAVQRGRLLLLRQPSAAEAVDMVIFGRVNVITDEVNPARVAALPLGLGEERVAFTMQINCGSGTQSTDTAFHTVGGEFDEFQEQEEAMGNLLYWAVVFLVIGLVAAALGFGGVAGVAIEGARLIFWVAIVLFVIALISGLLLGRGGV